MLLLGVFVSAAQLAGECRDQRGRGLSSRERSGALGHSRGAPAAGSVSARVEHNGVGQAHGTRGTEESAYARAQLGAPGGGR